MQAALWQSENLQRPHKNLKWWHIQISSYPSGTRGQRWCQPQHHLYSMRHAIESRWSIYDIQLLSESNGRHEDWDTYVGTHREGYMGTNQRDKISSLIDCYPTPSFRPWRSAVLLWFLPWQTSGKLCSKKRQASLRTRYRAPKIIIREETPRSALP